MWLAGGELTSVVCRRRVDFCDWQVETYAAQRLPAGSCRHVAVPGNPKPQGKSCGVNCQGRQPGSDGLDACTGAAGDDMDAIARRYLLTWLVLSLSLSLSLSHTHTHTTLPSHVAGPNPEPQTPSPGHPTTLHPTPYTLHPTPYTIHHTPLHPKPETLHPKPETLHPTPLHPEPLHPTPYTLPCLSSNPTPYTLSHKSSKPSTINLGQEIYAFNAHVYDPQV